MQFTISCADATPSHSYTHFDGRVGDAEVDTDSGTVVYFHPTGGKYPKTFAELYYSWSNKGTNARSAQAAMKRLGDRLRAVPCCRCDEDGTWIIPEPFERAGRCWYCGRENS